MGSRDQEHRAILGYIFGGIVKREMLMHVESKRSRELKEILKFWV